MKIISFVRKLSSVAISLSVFYLALIFFSVLENYLHALRGTDRHKGYKVFLDFHFSEKMVTRLYFLQVTCSLWIEKQSRINKMNKHYVLPES